METGDGKQHETPRPRGVPELLKRSYRERSFHRRITRFWMREGIIGPIYSLATTTSSKATVIAGVRVIRR